MRRNILVQLLRDCYGKKSLITRPNPTLAHPVTEAAKAAIQLPFELSMLSFRGSLQPRNLFLKLL
jgi:hypothetical protein